MWPLTASSKLKRTLFLRVSNCEVVKSKYFLGLTASGDDKNFHKVTKYHKIVDHISYNEAKEK